MIIPLCAAALAVLLLLWLFLSRKKSILRVLLPLAAAAVLLTGGIALAGPAVFLPAAQEEENRYPPGVWAGAAWHTPVSGRKQFRRRNGDRSA